MAKLQVKAMGLVLSPDGDRFLASTNFDSVKQQPYLRLLGGGVEFGERSEDALRREFMEELGAAVTLYGLLAVSENIFVHEGRPGHEIVFIYATRFADPGYYERAEIPVIEPDKTETALWTSCRDLVEGRVFLYPTADYPALLAGLAAARRP
jgi:ADP-ribose pyrophosphatase YjhB (NUDIX family)